MNYYKITKEQRMQYDRINDVVEEAEDFINDIWSTLDHDVTDTLDDDGTEASNFQDNLTTFIFEWVMGEKMPDDIKEK